MDSDGDVVVMVGRDLWLFNPAALEDMSGGEATTRRGETSPTSPGKKLLWLLHASSVAVSLPLPSHQCSSICL